MAGFVKWTVVIVTSALLVAIGAASASHLSSVPDHAGAVAPDAPPDGAGRDELDRYAQDLATYATALEADARWKRRVEAYDRVVEGTWVDLLKLLLKAFLAFAGVSLTAQVVNNEVRRRKGDDLLPLSLIR